MQLISIDSIFFLKTTLSMHQTGHWKILTVTNKYHNALLELDAQIQAQPQSFHDIWPKWQRKPVEFMPSANKSAWLQQNKEFTAAPPPKTNAWLKHGICTVQTKPLPTKADDKSTSTFDTTSSYQEKLDTL